MRAVVLLAFIIGVFSATNAVDVSALKDAGKQVLDNLVNKGKELLTDAANNLLKDLLGKLGKRNLGDAAKEALDQLVNKGKDVLKDAASKLLQDLLGKLGKRDLSLARDVVKGLAGTFQSLVESGKETTKKLFSDALDRLKELAERFHKVIGAVESTDEFAKEVDSIVEDHTNQQKRFVSDLVQKGKDLLAGLTEKAKELLSNVKAKASEVVSALIQKGADVLGKRQTLSDHLQKVGNVISTLTNPFKDVVANLGNTLKGHFTNLLDTVKGHANALKDKLTPHIDDLKGHGQKLLEHGKNAVAALSEVVQDVLKQTLNNASSTLTGVAGTLKDAGKTAVDHFTGADKTTSN